MYWKVVAFILVGWFFTMILSDSWHLLLEWWEVPLTMVFGSFVAGFSAQGGGAVAFPVFTKILGIAPDEAKQFSLLIQSFGMTSASLDIICRKTPFYVFAILPAVVGGAIGQVMAVTMNWFMPGVHLKWLFSITGAALGVALAINACMCGIVAWKYCRQKVLYKPVKNEQNQDCRYRRNRHGFETDYPRPAAFRSMRGDSDTGQK